MKQSKLLFIFLFFFCASLTGQKKVVGLSSLERELVHRGFVNVQRLDTTLYVNLKYATTDNFTGVVLYDALTRAYLHPVAAEKLVKAHQLLKEYDPELRLLVYDGARPLSVQRRMYDVVKDTPLHSYVAHPDRTGLHNYGMAVDLTICDTSGEALDMGTPFDYFGRAAAIRDEEGLVREGLLTNQQVENRRLLRRIMIEAGFLSILGEWWHFNAVPLYEARAKYQLIE